MREQNIKKGAGDNQFGIELGDIRTVAKKIKTDVKLALALWQTENIDTRLLSTILVWPKELSVSEMDGMVRSINFVQVADWFNAYTVKHNPNNETLRASIVTILFLKAAPLPLLQYGSGK